MFLGFGSGVANTKQSVSPPPKRSISPDQPNPAETITEQPSQAMGRIGWVLRTLLLSMCMSILKNDMILQDDFFWDSTLLCLGQNTCLKDRKVSGRLVRRCAPGTELVDWMLSLSPSIHTRPQAAGMWQALLEEGVIAHGEICLESLSFLSYTFSVLSNVLYS